MTKAMSRIGLVLAVLVGASGWAKAELVGVTFSGQLSSGPGTSLVSQFSSPQVVVDPGVEFTGVVNDLVFGDPFQIQADLSDHGLDVIVTYTGSASSGTESGVGQVDLTELGAQVPSILSVVASATNPGGATFSFTTDSISVTVGTIDFSQNVPIDFHFDVVAGAAAVPEPSSLALCGIGGVVGLVVARARRKRLA
jgi:hypothetical protein